jgi:uncharacterized protein (DUF849 family)
MTTLSNKVIITCAVTGAIHTPTLSEGLPYKPADIARQAIDAARAGAAILHLHARNPQDGSPTGDPEVFAQFLPEIHASTDAVINLTTGGSPEMTVEQRLAASLRFQPEMCSLNMGSMNFSFHGMGSKVKEWKFPWEKKYIEDSEAFIFRNTFRDVTRVYQIIADFGTRYEHECYDIGHLYNLAYFLDKGLVKPPLWIQSVFGILGGIGADPDNVTFMRRTADRLFGNNYVWSVLVGAGRRPLANAVDYPGRHDGRQRARGARGLPLHWSRQASRHQRRAGAEDPQDSRGTRVRDRHGRRGAADPLAQGSH